MELGINYEQAQSLVDKNISDEITRLHLIETEAIMRALALHFDENEEEWGIIGLLHDIDWDLTKCNPKEHGNKIPEILEEVGGSDELINAIESHIYGHGLNERLKNKRREHRLEHALAAAETVTGLIVAVALVQPDKKLNKVKLDSLKKKFKQKAFAAGCDREIIRECERIGLDLDEFLNISLKALQNISSQIGL